MRTAKKGQRPTLPVAQPVAVAREAEHAVLAIEPRQIIEPRKPVGRKMQHSPAGSAATGFGGNRRCHEIRQVDVTEQPHRCRRRAAEAAAICAASAFSP